MSSYVEYLLFIGIIVCLWGAWRLRINSLDGLTRRSSDRNYRYASWALIGIAVAGALIMLVSQ